ncbi:MAG: HD domain-containing protein [Vicinamibacterales bacterium]
MRERRPPRLVVKVLGFSFAVIALVLAAVFVALTWQARERLTRAIVDTLEAGQQRLADLERDRRREQLVRVETLAENPTLKAAVDTWQYEHAAGGPADQLRRTIAVELDKLQARLGVPALSVTDIDGRILASAGPNAGDWPVGSPVGIRTAATPEPVESIVDRGGHVYLATRVPLALGPDVIGQFLLATPLDEAFADALARAAGTDVAVLIAGRVVALSASAPDRAAIEGVRLPVTGTVVIGGEEFVVRRLSAAGDARIYAVASVTAAIRDASAEAAGVLVVVGLGALGLAAMGSLWLARTVSAPIDGLTRTMARMARDRDLAPVGRPDGASREVDALARTFDGLRQALAAAEAESKATYVGVIGSLAAALDARDPYTAGHSERVAALSVATGARLGLDAAALETLRLGALLHDIGKIGVPDAILRKPGTLTDAEFEQIKRHPTLGARILRPLPFLADHLAIVELHHEQPDGGGYPHGLRHDQVPLPARIVHVADAFDAMTTARAHRPGRPVAEAMAELRRGAGRLFDAAVVEAFEAIAPVVPARPAAAAASLVAFRDPVRGSTREQAG